MNCPTCNAEINPTDFISISFILGGDICRHCLDGDPSGSEKQSTTIWLSNVKERRMS
jgi:hypothetical protein